MVSDLELIGRLRELLRNSDLNTTTTGSLRRKLEEDFGVDLSDKKVFIREQVFLLLRSQQQGKEAKQGGGGGGNGGGGEAENGDEKAVEKKEDDEEGDGSDSKEEDDEEGEGEEASNGKSNAKRGSQKSNNEVKRRRGGFCKLCSLSPKLQEFVGVPELARTEVVKQLWSYIREKNLQDPRNRQNIMCDEPLHALFGVKSINMFRMNKALSRHIWPLDSEEVLLVKSVQKEKQQKRDREEDLDESKREEKRPKGGKSGFLAPVPVSDALVKFLGTGESALSRADAVKRMWNYIKQNNLQDPSDRRRIICDEKLKELFGVNSFNGFSVTKLLAAHFIKTEQ